MDERRKNVRVGDDLLISYRMCKTIFASSSRLKDISLGGIRLPVQQHWGPGTMLELDFSFPETKELLKTKGEVKWSLDFLHREYRYLLGVQFIELSLSDRDRIKDHIMNRLAGTETFSGKSFQ